MKLSKRDLVNFEKDIKDTYSVGKIKAPVHLVGGNEEPLLEIFKHIKKNDWVFSTHRSHYHCLLKSQNPKWVKDEILAKRSICMHSKKHKIFTSAIVGGNLPIALGVALALKLKKSKSKVYCFIGDMANKMGIFTECQQYASNFNLPIKFIIEDNGFGVYTPTEKVWGEANIDTNEILKIGNWIYYKYKRTYPHYGIGTWVTF